MSKNLTRKQWIKVIQIYNEKGIYKAANEYIFITQQTYKNIHNLRNRIKKKAKLVNNIGMQVLKRKPGSGRPNKIDNSDIPAIIDELNEEQKREIIEDWIKEQRKKKRKKEAISTFCSFSITLKAKIVKMDRTSFYKKPKQRIYKFDFLRSDVTEIFNETKGIYGSRKIAITLEKRDIFINDRTLRNYMSRWNIATKTRVKKRFRESKNTSVKYKDLVKRNFNPKHDNIIATDVSYIHANETSNIIYLSVAISHKTKLIESFELSKENDSKLVLDTLKGLKRNNFILHSDHGTQYSSDIVKEYNSQIGAQISMSRVGNSLDNREVEYFFGCLKGEYLKHIQTHKMSYEEIENHITWYIKWYNTKRIQKRLHWKAPNKVSAYAI